MPPATVGGWLDRETRGRATIQADIGRDEESWVKRGGKKCRQRRGRLKQSRGVAERKAAAVIDGFDWSNPVVANDVIPPGLLL